MHSIFLEKTFTKQKPFILYQPWRKFNIAAIIYSTRTNTLTL